MVTFYGTNSKMMLRMCLLVTTCQPDYQFYLTYLASPDVAAADVNEEGNSIFGWADNAGTGTAKENDTAILVAYFPEQKDAVFQFSEAKRIDAFALLHLSSKKGVAETWLGFLSADGKNAANSVYTGRPSLI